MCHAYADANETIEAIEKKWVDQFIMEVAQGHGPSDNDEARVVPHSISDDAVHWRNRTGVRIDGNAVGITKKISDGLAAMGFHFEHILIDGDHDGHSYVCYSLKRQYSFFEVSNV